MLRNLCEAHSELKKLRDRVFAQLYPDSALARKLKRFERVMGGSFDERSFFISLEHAYHHVNWAWNCRNKDEQRAIKCAWRDYLAWEKFPKEFKEFWPPPSRCQSKPREPYNGKMSLTLSRIALDDALFTIEEIFRLVGRRHVSFVSDYELKNLRPKVKEKFANQMCHLYVCLNRAWNQRKVNRVGGIVTSAAALRRHSYFPRAFVDLWPKRMRGVKSES